MEFQNGICYEGEGGLACHLSTLKKDFYRHHFESFPDCQNMFCTLFWALYYVHIVVEVTMNMAKY